MASVTLFDESLMRVQVLVYNCLQGKIAELYVANR